MTFIENAGGIMNADSNNFDNPVDRVVARRLAKLRSTTVDTTAFDTKLREALSVERSPNYRLIRWPVLTPIRAVAASFLVVTTLSLVFIILTSRPAVATPQKLAAIFENAVSGQPYTTKVSSIQEAQAVMRRKWPESPILPDVSDMQLMQCCVHQIGRKKMACLTFYVDQQPITLAMASVHDIRSPYGEVRTVNGQEYRIGSAEGVNMVMSEVDGTWMCLMGRLPIERLITLINEIRQ